MDNEEGGDGGDDAQRNAVRPGSTADIVNRLQRDGELTEGEAECVTNLLQNLQVMVNRYCHFNILAELTTHLGRCSFCSICGILIRFSM